MAIAAITAENTYRESMGSTTLIMATFASVSTGQWTHGLPNVVAYWCSVNSIAASGLAASICTSGSTSIILTCAQTSPAIIYALSRT